MQRRTLSRLLPEACEDGVEILEDAVGLGADVSGDDLLGGGINGDLSGGKDQALGTNRLRVGADGFGSVVGGDDFAHKSSPYRWVSLTNPSVWYTPLPGV